MGDRKSDLKNTRFYGLKLSKSTDGALIAKLDSQESVQGYLKTLIRADIEKEDTGMKLYEGYNQDGAKVEIVLEDGRIWIVDTETGDREQYNDEWYSEDDTASLASVKASMISEGFRL